MKIDYSELRKIYRIEKNTSKLVDVDENFFSSAEEFFKKEKEKYLESLKEPDSSKTRDFENLQRLVKDLFDLREKKLLNKALISSRTNETNLNGLSSEEKKTFEKISNVLEEHKKFLGELFENNKKSEKSFEKKSKTFIKIVKDVPAFVGSDMKQYGPFDEGKEIELADKTASLLLKRGLAEKI